MNRKYIHVWIDENAWWSQSQCVINLVDEIALQADGYLLSEKGKRFFNNFFQEHIFSQADYAHMIESGLRLDKAGMQKVVDTIEQQFDRFDQTHQVTAEQVLLQFCGMIVEITGNTEIQKAEPERNKELEKLQAEHQKAVIAQQKVIDDLREVVAKLKDENEYLHFTLADERAETKALRQKMKKKTKHRSLGDRVLQLIGLVYWIVDRIAK